MKKVFRGVVNGNVIQLEEDINIPKGTQAIVTLKTIDKKEQIKITARHIKLLDKGFHLGKKLYSKREELYDK